MALIVWLAIMSDLVMNIVECRHCGKAYWFEVADGGAVDGGPCCFGHPIMDIERFPTLRDAVKGYREWRKDRSAALKARLDEIKQAARMREAA